MRLYKTLVIVLCVTTLYACGGAEERKATYLEKARISIEAGDYDKARIELKNVLQIDPKDAEAYYQLGRVYEKLKEIRKAYRHYAKAEELNPDLLENQARLGRLYLLLANDIDKAQEKVDLILSKDPENYDGLLLKAAIKLKTKNVNEAVSIARGVVAKEPSHVEAVAFLASLYMKENKSAEALKVLDSAVKVNPDDTQLNKLLAMILVENKDYGRAEEIYIKALEKNPDSSSSYNDLAAFYNQSGDKAKAEKTLRASVENDQSDVNRQLVLVKYISDIRGNDAAIDELKELIVKNKGLGELRMALAEIMHLNGDKKSAAEVYIKAISDFSEEKTGVESRIALASIYIRDNDLVNASEIIEEAFKISPNDSGVNLLRAQLALFNKDIEKAIISLRIVTKETPDNVSAYLLLANAYRLEKNKDQIRNTINTAYENNKLNADALLKLAQYQLNRDIEQAEKIIDDYNKIKNSDYDGLSIKTLILNQKKMFPEAYAIAETLMESFPDKPNGYIQTVPYLSSIGEKQKAISTIEKGYISSKDNRKLLILLTTLQVSEKQFDVVEKRIKAEITASPDDAELKILLAKVHMASNDTESAKAMLNEIVANNPESEEPYLLLVKIYQFKNDAASVKATLLKGKSNVPSSLKIALGLATVYESNGDYQRAIEIYHELYETNPNNLVVINNLASMLSDHGSDLELARTLAEKLQTSGQPIFLDTIGWVYYKLGDYTGAIQNLTQAVEQAPDINVFNYHLGMAYKMAGDKPNARIYLEKSLSNNKNFKEKGLAEQALKDI